MHDDDARRELAERETEVYERLCGYGLFSRGEASERILLAEKLASDGMQAHDIEHLLLRASGFAKQDPKALVARWLQTGAWRDELATWKKLNQDPPLPGGSYRYTPEDGEHRQLWAIRQAWCRVTGDQRRVDEVAAEFRTTPQRLRELFELHREALSTDLDEIAAWFIADPRKRVKALRRWLKTASARHAAEQQAILERKRRGYSRDERRELAHAAITDDDESEPTRLGASDLTGEQPQPQQ